MIGLSMWIVMAQRAKGYDEKRAKRNRGVRRVVAYALAMSLVLGLGAMHRAKAAAGEAARGVGRDLAALADVLTEARELRLNGEQIFVSSSSSTAPVKETLDRFAENCAKSPTGVYRDDDESEGAVACGRDDMRYVYAKRSANGTTHVLAAWTERAFDVDALSPRADGDTAGSDSAAVDRPAHARRLLTAQVVGTRYAVRVYASTESADAVLAAYDATMTGRGWERLADEKHPGERSYVKDGVVITMVVAKADAGSTVTIAEM